jgi:hypothetical protein
MSLLFPVFLQLCMGGIVKAGEDQMAGHNAHLE